MVSFMIGLLLLSLAGILAVAVYMSQQDETEVSYYADLDDDGKPYV